VYANLIRSEEETARNLLLSNSLLGRSMRRQKELLEAWDFCEIRLRHGLVSDELLRTAAIGLQRSGIRFFACAQQAARLYLG